MIKRTIKCTNCKHIIIKNRGGYWQHDKRLGHNPKLNGIGVTGCDCRNPQPYKNKEITPSNDDLKGL